MKGRTRAFGSCAAFVFLIAPSSSSALSRLPSRNDEDHAGRYADDVR